MSTYDFHAIVLSAWAHVVRRSPPSEACAVVGMKEQHSCYVKFRHSHGCARQCQAHDFPTSAQIETAVFLSSSVEAIIRQILASSITVAQDDSFWTLRRKPESITPRFVQLAIRRADHLRSFVNDIADLRNTMRFFLDSSTAAMLTEDLLFEGESLSHVKDDDNPSLPEESVEDDVEVKSGDVQDEKVAAAHDARTGECWLLCMRG